MFLSGFVVHGNRFVASRSNGQRSQGKDLGLQGPNRSRDTVEKGGFMELACLKLEYRRWISQ